MKFRRSIVLLGCFAAILMVLPFGAASHAKTILLKAGGTLPEKHKLNQEVFIPYMKAIEKRTNGRVKFKFYPASIMIKARQSREAVTKGIVDIAFPLSVWAFESQYPVSRIAGFPFIVDSSLHGSHTLYRMYEEIPEVRKEFSDVKVLGFTCTGSANLAITGKTVPTTLEQIKGATIWAGSQKSIDVAKHLGMNPRRLKLEDLYIALQRGIINGAMFAMAPAKSFKLVEVVNNWMVMNAYVSLQPSAMNLKTWNKLPKDIQAIFEELTPALTQLSGTAVDEESEHVTKELEKRGDHIYALTPAQRQKCKAVTQVMFDDWVKEITGLGMDGKAILEKVEALAEETRKTPLSADLSWAKAAQ